jgi:Ala-tRNA(Pro) deacylase
MYALLEKLNIPYRKVEHPEAGSMEELAEAEKQLGAVICKNLFL